MWLDLLFFLTPLKTTYQTQHLGFDIHNFQPSCLQTSRRCMTMPAIWSSYYHQRYLRKMPFHRQERSWQVDYLQSVPPLSKNIQRDAVARVQIRRAVTNSIPIHVPAIILSAAAEFDLAYGAGGDSMPKLSRICENDERASSRSLYQVPIYTRHPSMCSGILPAHSQIVTLSATFFFCSYTHACRRAGPALSSDYLRSMPKSAAGLQDDIDSVLRCLLQRPSTVHNCNSTFGVRTLYYCVSGTNSYDVQF